MHERCADIEDLERRYQQIMFSKVSDLIGKKKNNKNITIKKAVESIAIDVEVVKDKWKEYVAKLYHEARPGIGVIEIDNDENPSVIREEVRCAINEMRSDKDVGGDRLDAEVLQALGDFAVEQLTLLFQKVYETGILVGRMYESVFVAISQRPS